jgi:trans-feruloyl-CoA hydratase/vanillin synthase
MADTHSYDNAELTIDGPRATLRLNRPHKKNAMSPDLHRDMGQALTEVERHGNVKVLVLTGTGESFCAGMDLEKCFFEPFDDPDQMRALNDVTFDWFLRLKSFPAVTVASINGWCFGGGFELVGICDLAIASEDATFGLSEVNFGIFPGGGTMWATAHNLTRKEALYYSLTGEPFDGRRAVELGLINKAVPAGELEAETDALVAKLVDKNVHTLRATKEVYERTVFMDFPEAIEWEMAKLFELSYYSRDAWIRQGLQQFRDRQYRPGLEAHKVEAE